MEVVVAVWWGRHLEDGGDAGGSGGGVANTMDRPGKRVAGVY
jgi:hypothetical protein